MRTRVLVACHAQGVADALAASISPPDGGDILASAAPLSSVLRSAVLEDPDVVVLEHLAGEDDWAESIAQLKCACPAVRVLVLCDAYSSSSVEEFIRLGASGCVLKDGPGATLARAVLAVHAGEPWFGCRELVEALRIRLAAESAARSVMLAAGKVLTAREREVLALIGGGMTNKEIGRSLNISDHTVKTHLHRVYVKLRQSGRYKAFVCNGAIGPDPAQAADANEKRVASLQPVLAKDARPGAGLAAEAYTPLRQTCSYTEVAVSGS
jgi:DNA-binding NarL/FixJ family response regulator